MAEASSGGPRRVLVTGGLGSIGSRVVAALVDEGHRVRCLDAGGRGAARRRRAFPRDVEVLTGDIRDADAVKSAVDGQDAVVHCAAVLYPDSEQDTALSRSVNVDGTRVLLDAMAASARCPAMVFASSIAVHGASRTSGPPRGVDDPLAPGTEYSRHKVECERMIREAAVPWTILRVGAALEPGASTKLTPLALRTMFRVTLDTRIEWVHPSDAALAMARAAARDDLRSRVLMIAGGESCRATQREFFSLAFESIGIGMLPDEAFGGGTFEMDWMETEESQRLLGYQRHTWQDFHRGFVESMRLTRYAVRPLRPLVRRGLLGFSDPWKQHRARATRRR